MAAPGRVVILGARGQVGSALMELLGEEAVGITRSDADLTNQASLFAALTAVGPVRALVNAAAYNNVDRAESERELAFAVNADLPRNAASWAAQRAIPFVHYSTEYVFPDGSDRGWREEDPTQPLNIYGESKRAGEVAVCASEGERLVIRTSWVYSTQHRNFVWKVLELAKSSPRLQMVADQWGSPTHAVELAKTTIAILREVGISAIGASGVLHLAGLGMTNRADFARAILDAAVATGVLAKPVPVDEIKVDEFATNARRPTHCTLDCSRAESLGFALPAWRDSLTGVVTEMRR